MDAGAYVSDENVQIIWGKILAGEFERPGSTPPSMRRILTELTPELARVFEKICGMKASGGIQRKKNKRFRSQQCHFAY